MSRAFIASSADDGGIYCFDLNGEKLVFTDKIPLSRPMYLAAEGERLYAVCAGESGSGGSLVSFKLKDGRIEDVDFSVSSLGVEPCHLCADRGEIYVVNYGSGNAVKFPEGKIVSHRGSGVNPVRQDAAHTHMACFSPRRNRVFVTDLGLDKIFVYDRGLNYVSAVSLPAGCGPRHIALSPDGRYAYCVNELIPSVSVLSYAQGALEYLDTVEYPVEIGFDNTAAALRINADGSRLYVSVRGENTVAAFGAEGAKVAFLSKTSCGGDSPRDINITPCGKYLVSCNEKSDSVAVFSLKDDGLKQIYSLDGIPHPLAVLFY